MISVINEKKSGYKKTKLYKNPNVAGQKRVFDPILFDKYDPKARYIIKKTFPDHAIDNPDMYGEDLIFKHNKIPYKFIEVQVYATWDGDKFPYTFPFVYARKMRFSKDTLFIAFNKFFTELVMFGRNALDDKPSRLKKYDRELVHYVSWNHALKTSTELLTLDLIADFLGIDIDQQ